MLTVAVLQQKGGSRKTTLAVNLAAATHLDGRRALVVEMDRQASAFDWSAARNDGSRLDGLTVVNAACPFVTADECSATHRDVLRTSRNH